jgi:8-oxo-dGTP pyrophosphatase MutT (NUDIX family)
MYKIYFDHKPLFLSSTITKEIEEYTHHEETILIDEFNAHSVKAMIHQMQEAKITAGVFIHADVDILLNAFKKKFKVIIAAGGLVYSENDHVLLIFRKSRWDLPKGKTEAGESLESCAVREVQEETGIKNIQLEKSLITTYHTYRENNNYILKESHWYLMYSEKLQAFIPQIDEDIEKCEWVTLEQLPKYQQNMHASICDVLHTGKNITEKIIRQ